MPLLDDAGGGAAPAGVEGGDDALAGVGDEDGDAIGGEDGEGDGGECGEEAVGFDWGLWEGGDGMGLVGVSLAGGDEGPGARVGDGLEEAMAVFLDGGGSVLRG